ncbi:MAG: FHA domain-containing protein [Desulfobacteraceae bacterium]|nr:MAG: FHA domain-containing protein [Desulfobacteraceae bacterium]
MSTKETPNTAGLCKLIVLQGPDRGKEFHIDADCEYVIGRAEECRIRMDASDKTVSRQHARLTTTAGNIRIENLSAANPVQIKDKPIQAAALKHKGQFRIGETLFAVEQTGGAGASASSLTSKKILIFGGLGFVCLMLILVIFSGGNDSSPQKETGTMPANTETDPPGIQTTEPGPEEIPSALPASGSGLTISSEDIKTADAHFRQGMFFYDTGNLSKAVDEWNQAVVLYPDHPDARVWFLRAEKELETQAKTHYQNAMMHYKYMRYDDAAHEFRLVIELSKDKTGDQYLNALKTLNELEGR